MQKIYRWQRTSQQGSCNRGQIGHKLCHLEAAPFHDCSLTHSAGVLIRRLRAWRPCLNSSAMRLLIARCLDSWFCKMNRKLIRKFKWGLFDIVLPFPQMHRILFLQKSLSKREEHSATTTLFETRCFCTHESLHLRPLELSWQHDANALKSYKEIISQHYFASFRSSISLIKHTHCGYSEH